MRDHLVTPEGFLLPWAADDVDAVVAAFALPEMLRQSGGEPIDKPEAAEAWAGGETRRLERRIGIRVGGAG